jgi:hypothetical protein
MGSAIYRKLQEQLDHYSVGFPATESGIEIEILEKLFTEKEAEIFLQLSMFPEFSETIAARLLHCFKPFEAISFTRRNGQSCISSCR